MSDELPHGERFGPLRLSQLSPEQKAITDRELRLLEHLAPRRVAGLLARLDAPAGQRPAPERRRLAALDPHDAVGSAQDPERDARAVHDTHRSLRCRW